VTIPPIGMTPDEIMATLRRFKAHDMDWQSGRVFAYVYQPRETAAAVVRDAYMLYLAENCLDPTIFPSIAQLERDVVRMIAGLLQGDEQVAGNVTGGGTESILLAVKAARDWARAHRPHIAQPEMVLSRTAHAAFHKAAHYFGVKPVVVAFDPVTFEADVAAMRAAITDNTILLVASAPCYSQGVIDPVPAIASLAREYGLLCHVDACVGGIYLSFLRKLGYAVPPFDFSIPASHPSLWTCTNTDIPPRALRLSSTATAPCGGIRCLLRPTQPAIPYQPDGSQFAVGWTDCRCVGDPAPPG